MKLRVTRRLAIDFAISQPGSLIDVADEELARRLIAQGYATEATEAQPIKTATSDPTFETAEAPAASRKRRK